MNICHLTQKKWLWSQNFSQFSHSLIKVNLSFFFLFFYGGRGNRFDWHHGSTAAVPLLPIPYSSIALFTHWHPWERSSTLGKLVILGCGHLLQFTQTWTRQHQKKGGGLLEVKPAFQTHKRIELCSKIQTGTVFIYILLAITYTIIPFNKSHAWPMVTWDFQCHH